MTITEDMLNEWEAEADLMLELNKENSGFMPNELRKFNTRILSLIDLVRKQREMIEDRALVQMAEEAKDESEKDFFEIVKDEK